MECRENIPLFKVYMNDEVGPLVNSVLYSGWIGQGPKVAEFEKKLGTHLGNDKVLGLSAGTHGLSLALRLAGVGPGDEVITTPLTCLSYLSSIETSLGPHPIGKIVNQKIKAKVKSFNEQTGKVEWKNITNWIKIPSDNVEWYNIYLKDGNSSNSKVGRRSLWITGDHKILTFDGYKRVDDLNNDLVATDYKTPNSRQIEFINGTMLGDGYVQECSQSARLTFSHCKEQKEWVDFKERALNGFKITRNKERMQTEMGLTFKSIRKKWYSKNWKSKERKIIPDIELTPLTLATWYMDDGSLLLGKNKGEYSAILCTEGFNKNYFWRLFYKLVDIGLKPTAHSKGNGYRIYLGNGLYDKHNSADIFFKIISPYIIPSMRYKLPDDIELDDFNPELWNLGEAKPYYTRIIAIKSDLPKSQKKYEKYVYCLEVEDNHNFISKNIVLSNCTATNMPILMHGAKIVWADIKPNDLNIDPQSIASRITDRTKAIIVVHWGGYPCDMKEIYDIASEHGIKVIEDGAHAFGSTYRMSTIGDCAYSDYSMMSFQAIKHLTSVTPETPVLIKRNDIIELIEIGKLDKTVIGNECMSFTINGKTKWSRIYDFIKHPVKEKLLNVKLEKGRQVNITKNHSVYTYRNEKFSEIFGSELKVGDYLAVPRKLNITNKIIEKIDLLETLKHKTLMVNNNKIRLGYEGRGSNAGKWIDRYLNIDEDFCKILGYYIAEGSITKSYSRNGKITENTPLSCIFSMGTHEEYTRIQDLIECLERKFPFYKAQKYKVNTNKTGIKIHFGSTLFAEIIKAMNVGENTYKKRIPDIIWNVSDNCKNSFLKGYFNGDGYKRCQDGYTNYQQWTSASKELTNGIHYLLLSMGIQTSSLELSEGYKLNKKEEEMNRYSGYVINQKGQETSKENCIPNEFVEKYNSHDSFSIKRIKKENLSCPKELLEDIALLKIKEINEFDYDGYVYDFSVEEVENFIGGFGAICLHNTVDGGALFIKDIDDYKRAKLLRWYGIDRESLRRDMRCEEEILEFGYKYHMNDVCATIGLANFYGAIENVGKARENAEYYNMELLDIPGVKLIQTKTDRLSSYWLYTLLVEDRTSFAYMMGSKGISVSRVHERNDKHAFVREYKKELPGLESVIDKMICIPIGWWVSQSDREYIVETIKGGW